MSKAPTRLARRAGFVSMWDLLEPSMTTTLELFTDYV